MNKCRQCGRGIRGSTSQLTVSADESIPLLPAGETTITFCGDRCKRDWLDELVGMGWDSRVASMTGDSNE